MATPVSSAIVVSTLAALLSVGCVAVSGSGPSTPTPEGTEVPVPQADSPALDDGGVIEALPVVDASTDAPAVEPDAAVVCANPEDMDDDQKIAFTVSVSAQPAPLSPACVRLKKGKTLRYAGDLTFHPLEVYRLDGSPLPPSTKGPAVANGRRLDDEGTFAVRCTQHPAIEHAYVVVAP